ncbi:mediator of RNA polymerase II transcription subunit 1 isoform X1 [Nasonia vitripennis]|uniref:Mediator of RNA polymerase II transcription subunit 1 n=1 Tax=Nasonia vitripennis TaxID=7425 RepID=A0A7M7QSM8_NASVI|nr:mediator of RNA polymerase II transcription subunit 1 isoform X1 [Nasonia vitripennis]
MTSALPVNGFIGPNGVQPALAEQTTGGGVVSSDKSKEWQMELLMEKLRSKASSFKSLVETAKNIRMAMLDKRFGIDSVEKNQLQKSLDALQHSIRVTSLQSMIERLESLSRQLGLKFVMSGPPTTTNTELFISSDMFFLEVLLEPSGAVKDVKIHHDGKNEQQSEELVACLSRGDFVDFTTQLEGLASIYQLNADKKVKGKAFSALQSLETDLGILAELQKFMKEPFNVVHKSPVGILERRKGGHAMKLTYFVSPYDLIDQENKSCEALSLEAVISKKVGHSVTVCLEGSTAHKLPTSSIITVTRTPTGKSTPSYASLTSANSSMLPACFVLKLAKKMPMCLELIRKIQKVTDLECTDISVPYPLLSMIVQHTSDKQLDCQNNRGLTVSLPDQQHCYFMTENRNMEGVLVGSIPFTHPAHVPQILNVLRQQALFNTLISSCVRPMARQDSEHTTIFEVSALSWQCISVSLEHPFEETLATAELDLSDISALKCKLYGVSITNTEQTSDLAGKVLQRCLSVPLTMRTLIKAWEGRTFMLNPIGGGNNGFNSNLGTGREQNNHNGSNVPEFGNEDIIIKQEPGTGMNGTGSTGRQQQQQAPTQQQQPQQNQQQNQQQQQSFLEAGAENSIGFPSFSGSSDTPPVAMLNPLQLGALSSTPTPSGDGKSKKSRKRKAADGSWKSPKRKNDLDSNEILLESSSSDSTPLGTPTGSKDVMNDARTPTPTSAASIASAGLDLSNLDPLDVLSTDKSSDYDLDNDAEIMQVEPTVASLEEALKRERKLKKRAEEKPSPTNVFEDNKTLVSPSVSITPISSGSSSQSASYNSMLTSIGLDRRPGIEIIPIASLPQTPLLNSITITAINNPAKSSTSSSSTGTSSSSSGTSQGLGDERSKERKSSKNRSSSSSLEDKNKLEKKRKRKRESSPMGPPGKLPLKQVSSNVDPLSKPVSVSIKPASESPPSSARPSSPATTLRKFSPSPTRNNPLVLVGKSSPTSLKQSSSSSSSSGSTGGNGAGGGSGSKPVPSPKHSPVYSSPKHMSSMPSSSVSPKHGTSSPKHGNSGSAGKPSMSALKSAANSPSGKSSDGSGVSSKTKISSLQSSTSPSSSAMSLSTLSSSTSSSSSSSLSSKESRDKEARKTSSLIFGSSSGSSSGHQSPKSKSISSKPKAIDSEQQQASLSTGSGGSTPPSDPSKSALTSTQQQQQQARNRKGSLSAVIDKLKNAQHCTDDAMSSSGSNLAPSSTTGGSSSSSSASNSASKNPSDAKNPTEYMVKPSSDGMKLTINKTRTKDLKSNSSGLKLSSVALGGTSGSAGGLTITPVTMPGNILPKLFSGLKAGVISGPVSRKPQVQTSAKVRSTSPLTSSSGMGSGKSGLASGQKLSSGGLKSSSGSGLLSSSSGLAGKSLSAKSFSSTGGSSMKQSSIAAELGRARDKARFKTAGDKSFAGKGNDLRKSIPSTVESENEKALRQHLNSNILTSSMSGLSNLSGLMVEGLIKQLDTKFQIPKLSARANAADNADKRSVDKVDSGSKSSDAPGRSSQIMSNPAVSSSSNVPKLEEAHPVIAHGASNSVVGYGAGSASTSSSSANAISAHESDVPTNLSMQPDESLQMKAEVGSGRPFLNPSGESSKEGMDLAGSKHSSYSMGSDTTGNLESLNLVTKGSEKYKSSDDKDQQQQQQQHAVFHRLPHADKKSVESSITTPASITLTPIPPVSSSASAGGSGTSSQEAAEMLLDFSTPKESGGGGGSVSSLPLKSAMSFAASSSSPIRKNTTPPPPPPPPPLPPPPPPSVSPAVLAAVPPSVSPISSFPQSPSVSLHIVKSPAPSPRVIPLSPHSASPCITDDELMDEAIVGGFRIPNPYFIM